MQRISSCRQHLAGIGIGSPSSSTAGASDWQVDEKAGAYVFMSVADIKKKQ